MTIEQNHRFHSFMSEIADLYISEKNAEFLLEHIEKAFENDELTTSQYDKLVRECEDFISD